MKRERDPAKPRRKFKAANTRSPGKKMLASQRRRVLSIDPGAGPILEQIQRMIHGKN